MLPMEYKCVQLLLGWRLIFAEIYIDLEAFYGIAKIIIIGPYFKIGAWPSRELTGFGKELDKTF